MSDEHFTPEDGPKTPLAIFHNDKKKSERAPDYRGDAILTDTLISQIVALRNAGLTPVLGFAGWTQTARNGKSYLSGSLSIDTYKMAKRHGKDRSEIETIMDGGEPQAPAPQQQDSGGDFFSNAPAPTPETSDDPFAGTPEPQDQSDDPFAGV